jgi:hypothetical protein
MIPAARFRSLPIIRSSLTCSPATVVTLGRWILFHCDREPERVGHRPPAVSGGHDLGVRTEGDPDEPERVVMRHSLQLLSLEGSVEPPPAERSREWRPVAWWRAALLGSSLRRAAAVIVPSQWMAGALSQRYHVAGDRLRIGPGHGDERG